MVYFKNDKNEDSVTITIVFKTPLKGEHSFTQEYSRHYLETIKFDTVICSNHIRGAIQKNFKGIIKKDKCRIINHVVATINDYKRYGIRNRK